MQSNSLKNRSESGPSMAEKKYKGVRRRKWGKWVSEIRVPGSTERLWLGSYATAEAAAVAHDIAFYCLRRPPSLDGLNFPQLLPARCVDAALSPKSVQKAASDAGMGIDAQMIVGVPVEPVEAGRVFKHYKLHMIFKHFSNPKYVINLIMYNIEPSR
ncbi:ethylene-responsive transcription factor ERF020-like [Pistacia vera]|uniref:ethylene-responsive transcription factor ERF020-like n=1 Tax=Pistacia vera TaxID=55513 RepID=UPI00126330AA|nr:ethylene-responsive transcription factor ERF020-like [Pistacia vera]